MWNADEPFNELPPPPPSEFLETTAVLKAAIGARSALSALNQAIKTIPNPDVLIGSIPLLEAQASSEVENIVTTTDELFRLASRVDGLPSAGALETFRYRQALYTGAIMVRARPLSASTAMRVCSEIRGTEVGVRAAAGTHIANPSTGQVIYTPPVGSAVIWEKLKVWEDFIHDRPGLDPLITMAAAHYQFEAIHPFTDGNGRTGRVLNVLLLLEFGLLQEPVLYLSRYINENKAEYYRRLRAVTEREGWEEWILYMLRAVEDTSKYTLEMSGAIQAAREEFREAMRESSSGANADLLDHLFEQPYTRIKAVADACAVSRPTAAKWLRELVAAGLLTEQKSGRENLFLNKKLARALEDPKAS